METDERAGFHAEVSKERRKQRKIPFQTFILLMNVDDVTQSQKNSGAFHLARKSEFRVGNDITFELKTFQLQVRKSRCHLCS